MYIINTLFVSFLKKLTRAYLFQIALEIMWLPLQTIEQFARAIQASALHHWENIDTNGL